MDANEDWFVVGTLADADKLLIRLATERASRKTKH
jgi:hypothetical protein